MERIFLHDDIYDCDDVGLGLMIELENGKVIGLRTIQPNEEIEFLDFYSVNKKNDLSGKTYISIYTLEENIGCAYDNEDEEIIKELNRISQETNDLFRRCHFFKCTHPSKIKKDNGFYYCTDCGEKLI